MKKLIITIALGVVLLATPTTVSAQDAGGLLAGTNAQRSTPLTLNSTLSAAAQAKANDMVARNYWSHKTPDGQSPWIFFQQAGYKYSTAGENLAYGQDSNEQVIREWVASPTHYANIINTSFTEVGFGIVTTDNYMGGGQATLVVAFYGSPVPTPTPTPAPVIAETPKIEAAIELPEVLKKAPPTVSVAAASISAPKEKIRDVTNPVPYLFLGATGAVVVMLVVRRIGGNSV